MEKQVPMDRHNRAWRISDPLTGDYLQKDVNTMAVVTIQMDPSMPRPLVNRSPFDDPEAEWLEEPSDHEHDTAAADAFEDEGEAEGEEHTIQRMIARCSEH